MKNDCRTDITQDTTIRPLTVKDAKAFNVVFNSETYFRKAYFLKAQRVDSLTKALNVILEQKGLVLDTKNELDKVITNFKIIDAAQSDKINEMEKEVKKLNRQKKFWKACSIVAVPVTVLLTAYILK